MSVVTSVVIVVDGTDSWVEGRPGPTLWDYMDDWPMKPLPHCADVIGGGKCLEVEVAVSAWNHLDWEKFIERVGSWGGWARNGGFRFGSVTLAMCDVADVIQVLRFDPPTERY